MLEFGIHKEDKMDKIEYIKVKALIDENNLKESELYKALDISRQNWGNFKKTGVPNKYGSEIANFLGCDISILMPTAEKVITDYQKVTIKAYRNIVAGAGFGSDITDIEDLEFDPMKIHTAILPRSVRNASLKAIQVNGKSMLPTFMPDDWVVFAECMNTFQGDDVYVVNYMNNLLIKRITFNPALGKIDIISDNHAFPTYSVESNDTEDKGFMIIGRVVATIQQ